MALHRNFVFTHNNYDDTSLEDNIECRFIAYSHEVAPTTGTKHLQGYVCFKNPISHKTSKRKFPGCFISPMLGSISDNDSYISKLTAPIERGDKPMSNDNKGRAEKLRWQAIRELAKAGDLDKIDADIFIRYYGTLKRIRDDYKCRPSPLDNSTPGIWIHGPSRTGKSHAMHTAYPDAYIKGHHKWWDGYAGQTVVCIDDFSIYGKGLGTYIKLWVDKWAFDAETKGGRTMIRPEKVIVTSNYTIEDIWDDQITRDCLNNRFRVVEKLNKEQTILL